MSDLRFARDELLRSHAFATPHVVAGERLHGGFDAEGRYLPPRLLVRAPAIAAWTQALRARGGDLLPAEAELLSGVRATSEAQQKLLLLEGLGQTFWDMMTIIGEIEGRGRLLTEIAFPELGGAVYEDVSTWAVAHLNRGLLEAHGLDEGGEPERGIGGHDRMWFALRDLAFGRVGFPAPKAPPRIGRPDEEATLVPEIATRFERTIGFLMNLLLTEIRAHLTFSFTERLLRDPELFRDRRDEALLAAELVNRIRSDEAIHVESLRLYLGELRSLTFRTRDGGQVAGAAVIDRLWSGIVRWWTVEQPPLAAAQQHAILRERIHRHPEGARIWQRFETLAES
ncbi:MAG: hypothetical protein NTZ61_00705 [Proteobacteria bacterium]|nr:hypothetical protein [Pseudomonadota bacterium]